MKQSNLLSYLALPVLFFLVGTLTYRSILQEWNYEIVSYSIFVFTMIYLQTLERVIPFRANWQVQKTTFLADIKHLIISVALFDALGKTIAISLVLFLQQAFFKPFTLWEQFPFIVNFILANIIGEFFPYLYHRVSHIGKKDSCWSQFLWKTHAIHHLPVQLNWFKTNWVHPINMLVNTFSRLFPLLLMGFSEATVFAVGITTIVISYTSHANIKASTKVLNYLIITPQLHQFHHSVKLEEAQNFGNVIPFWDLVLGTYYNRKGEVTEVGVIENQEMNYPAQKAYWKQLVFPMEKRCKNCC